MSKIRNQMGVLGVLLFLIFTNPHFSSAQNDTIYFNKLWVECDKDKASFYRLYEVQDSIIKVENFYLNDQLYGSGFVRNEPGISQKLAIMGDLEGSLIDEWYCYKKNGKLSFQINYSPFDPDYGVSPEKLLLLDSLDTVSIDLTDFIFEIDYFKWKTEYGFFFENYTPHGHWTRTTPKKKKIISRAHNYKNQLDGLKSDYYRNGVIKRESYYKDGILHGEKKRYNRKGRLVEGKVYEDGTLIEAWRYHKPKK